jgi:hypothetical protein
MRKQLYTLVLFVLGIGWAQAEDIIYMINGTQQKAVVLEINTDEIKYRKSENPDGPVYIVKKSEVQMIEYTNGYRDIINGNRYTDQLKSQANTETYQNNSTATPSQQRTYVENNYYRQQPRSNVNVYVSPGYAGYGMGWHRPVYRPVYRPPVHMHRHHHPVYFGRGKCW